MNSRQSGAESTFTRQFNTKVELVNTGVGRFTEKVRLGTINENPRVQAIVESYISLLQRGGKRTRGILTLVGYEIMRGRNTEMISDAAGAMEAFHAYLLVGDDIADSSDLRRGSPAAHVQAAACFTMVGSEDTAAKHGADTAQLAALYAQHYAQSTILELDVPDKNKLLASRVMNNELALTSLGQILDVVVAASDDSTVDDIERVALYKTAHYSYLLPLQMGAALGGASADQLGDFTEYSLHAGFAFQLRDDLIGIYGEEAKTGKSRKSDIVEGKKTLLVKEALSRATLSQKAVLRNALGNPDLTDDQFHQCLNVIEETGAKQHIGELANTHARKATVSLSAVARYSPAHCVEFLRDMAKFAAQRQA